MAAIRGGEGEPPRGIAGRYPDEQRCLEKPLCSNGTWQVEPAYLERSLSS